jgi:hypothetical protein
MEILPQYFTRIVLAMASPHLALQRGRGGMVAEIDWFDACLDSENVGWGQGEVRGGFRCFEGGFGMSIRNHEFQFVMTLMRTVD